jgi:Ras-related protein Rab-18
VGNKSDLEAKRRVSTEEAQAFADKYGHAMLETSAKNGVNVDAAFQKLVRRIMERNSSLLQDVTPSARLLQGQELHREKKCCH